GLDLVQANLVRRPSHLLEKFLALAHPDPPGSRRDATAVRSARQLVIPFVRCMKAVSRLISSSLKRVSSNPCSIRRLARKPYWVTPSFIFTTITPALSWTL